MTFRLCKATKGGRGGILQIISTRLGHVIVALDVVLLLLLDVGAGRVVGWEVVLKVLVDVDGVRVGGGARDVVDLLLLLLVL